MRKANKYSKHKESVMKYFNKKGFSCDNVSEYSAITGLPLVLVYSFIIEDMPEHTDICKAKIKEINKFYGKE